MLFYVSTEGLIKWKRNSV